jgi:hypothetical protein
MRPIEAQFADFLYCHFIENDPVDRQWQNNKAAEVEPIDYQLVFDRQNVVDSHPEAMAVIRSIAFIFEEITKGNMDPFYAAFHNVKFSFVVGPPRTGGSYLLKELWRGQGLNADDLHIYMHDASPCAFAEPSRIGYDQDEIDLEVLWQLVQLAAAGALTQEKYGIEYVPKKTHAVPLYPELFAMLFPNSVYYITWRDIDGIAASIKDKCGPPRKVMPSRRSEIERHINVYMKNRGWTDRDFRQQGYMKTMETFVNQFYEDCEILPVRRMIDFGEGTQAFVEEYYAAHGVPHNPEKFYDRRKRGAPQG